MRKKIFISVFHMITLILLLHSSQQPGICLPLFLQRYQNKNTNPTNMKLLTFTAILFLSVSAVFAQVKYETSGPILKIEGTSSLHDWDMTSKEGVCSAVFDFAGVKLTNMLSLAFSVRAETLKSGTKGLNKNAYKAMNTAKYPTITFISNNANVRSTGANSYILNAKGKLTISGVTKEVSIPVTCTVNPTDMSIQANGSYKIKMSEYKVTPPSFMFGAMKTGDDLTINFNVALKK